jgi:hypothetical protein
MPNIPFNTPFASLLGFRFNFSDAFAQTSVAQQIGASTDVSGDDTLWGISKKASVEAAAAYNGLPSIQYSQVPPVGFPIEEYTFTITNTWQEVTTLTTTKTAYNTHVLLLGQAFLEFGASAGISASMRVRASINGETPITDYSAGSCIDETSFTLPIIYYFPLSDGANTITLWVGVGGSLGASAGVVVKVLNMKLVLVEKMNGIIIE